MKNYGKTFKLMLLVLLIISVALLVWGFIVGFETKDAQAVNVLLYWAYAMIVIALIACLVVGLIISIKNNPKSLVKYGIVLACAAVLCLIAYLLAKGNPAVGLTTDQPDFQTLKLTDSILNLTYICGVAAIVSIIVGEIVMAVRNK